MPRLVVVLPLRPLRLGDGWALNDWPLHLTVAPTFITRSSASEVGATIRPLLFGFGALQPVVGSEEGFGRAGDIPVTVIEPSIELSRLHRRLVAGLKASGAIFDDPEFIEDGYRAHVTKTRHAEVHTGDSLELTQITIVDMEPLGDGRLRRVVWTQPLPS